MISDFLLFLIDVGVNGQNITSQSILGDDEIVGLLGL